MLSINTNLSSLIAQSSLQNSTLNLNEAVERMSTGYKINHAKDNAANYSISTNLTTRIGAYQIAEDNAMQGLDMVNTAQDNIAQMESHAERLRSLSIQARNGTYGEKSLGAIQSEVNSIISEMLRIHSTTKYNGISLFDNTSYTVSDSLPKAGESGFISNPISYSQSEVENLDSIDTFVSGSSGTYKIMSADDLAKLADIVNSGKNTSRATFVMGADIDLTEWQNANGNWIPIGLNISNDFTGTFEGNGHTISNLKVGDGTLDYQGLFGSVSNATINDLGILDCDVKGGSDYAGGLVGSAGESSITNCFATGVVSGERSVGGLCGEISGGDISKCYADVSVSGDFWVGGLLGDLYYGYLEDSYSTGAVVGRECVGGLTGFTQTSPYGAGEIYYCYSTSRVTGDLFVGGLVGQIETFYNNDSVNISYSDSYSIVQGNFAVGTFIGGVVSSDLYDGTLTYYGDVALRDCSSISNGVHVNAYTRVYDIDWNNETYELDTSCDYNSSLTSLRFEDVTTNLQVGIHGNEYSNLNFDSNFQIDLSSLLTDISSNSALGTIDEFINLLSNKQTELGAVQNRLESALDEISTQYENLVSTRSTIRDADIAEVSASYIQQQILQQAAATLLATANQTPSIALQLL